MVQAATLAGRGFDFFLVAALLGHRSSAFPIVAFSSRHSGIPVAAAKIGQEELPAKPYPVLSYVDDLLDQTGNSKDAPDILKGIQDDHAADLAAARVAPLAWEDNNNNHAPIEYEWMSNRVAVQSLEPLFTELELQRIRQSAQVIWQNQGHAESSPSRFTYQYQGNSEAHVSDFVGIGPVGEETLAAINQCLTTKIYPWIRGVFFSEKPSPLQLLVYDALVIRYNATAAATHVAGQPLHRDLGLVSVNVMLNDGFAGGGTYFENQASDRQLPLKPQNGPGHALAHCSHERHAGAGTTKGVREILVLFVSAVDDALPRLVNARLKQRARDGCSSISIPHDPARAILGRIHHHRLAIKAVPEDGEAFQYLGTALLDYQDWFRREEKDATGDPATDALLAAVRCFQHAHRLTPGDARVYNNWGIALSKLEERPQGRLVDPVSPKEVYQRGLDLLRRAQRAGCLVTDDLDSLSLNYGLFLAKRDEFEEACQVLEATAARFDNLANNNRILVDAHRLWHFCCRQIVR